ncbi:MAG: tRNA (adenosine(37)-N6)-threonylcarbamoyltransferase complex dimerization subunit type 1 TsaB [Cellvibrionaceae bacterium]|nr:tRNA (adenosine(37)-N6)-threonylcarbamoyltransferase complex dimerization subunit type 1 TsaB [Cellvibrionaceae bacterium]
MTSILALDTSTDACSIALLHHSKLYSEVAIAPREHTQRLLPMIQALLATHQLELSALDGIAFGCGPGSFTGLRIGLSVAQGLAYGADLPLISVSSLQAMAYTAHRQKSFKAGTMIAPVIDARMDEVYWSAYRVRSRGGLDLLAREAMDSPNGCALELSKLHRQSGVKADVTKQAAEQALSLQGVGSGWRYAALSQEVVKPDLAVYPDAYDIALLADTKLRQGDTEAPECAKPVYLRNDITWNKRQRIRPVSN